MMIIDGGCGLCYSMPVPYYWIKTVLLRKNTVMMCKMYLRHNTSNISTHFTSDISSKYVSGL